MPINIFVEARSLPLRLGEVAGGGTWIGMKRDPRPLPGHRE
ncbi:MAG TPA: hypothetical protein VL485_05150 [Ktedonobacteraceae bacterium]|nr:hypothetical protein [Ktedonobacteraceae bacterium]